MHNYPLIGPASPERGWVPAPRYLMRRARILDAIATVPAGELLEIGSGAGVLLHEFEASGFHCQALESSEAARTLAAQLATDAGLPIKFHEAAAPDWSGKFDAVCAFEVLEHIKDDFDALSSWANWLKPGGTLLLSVPAKMKLWTAGDEWAGHFRRYEADGLHALLEAANLEVSRFECYGFPLTNLSERLSAPSYRRRIRRDAGDTESNRRINNDRSGIDRSSHLKYFSLLNSPLGRGVMRSFFWLQNRFLSTNAGSGYFVMAKRR